MSFSAATSGLILGDIYSRQNGVHRLGLISQRRLRRYEHLVYFSNLNNITTRPEPYVHGFAPEILGPYPSDDTEWFIFSRDVVLNKKNFQDEWLKLSTDYSQIRARLGVKAALRNLSLGLRSPQSGHDNPHYFDNAAMIRALGISNAFVGNQSELISLVTDDASHTNSEDGVWLAVATAVLSHSISIGASTNEAIAEAIKTLPKESWGLRETTKAITLTKTLTDVNDRVFVLERDFIDRIYPYPYSAPETFGLLCAHLQHISDPELLFSSTFQHRRHTDSLPVFIGFFMGLIHGNSWLPRSFLNQKIVLDGVALPGFKGVVVS